MLRTFLRRATGDVKDRGASAVEYGLMVAAIAAVIVAIVFGLGGLVRETFTDTCDQIRTESGGTLEGECTDPPAGPGG
jgi:pilus assembly protein Flp/PilA